MIRTKITALAALSATSLCAFAQNGMRMPDPYDRLSKREKTLLQSQASNIFNAAEPAVKVAAKSTVSINTRGKRLTFGTAVRTKDSKVAVLTKWSEVSNPRGPLSVSTMNGKSYPAKVAGVYPEHDLALVTTSAPLTPLDLNNGATPGLGNFLVLARPDGKVEGIGVVSVLARSLREKDKAYLGVMMDFTKAGKEGVPLQRVMPDSAAMKSGLRDGDIIVSVDQKPITGAMQMRNTLQRLEPGSEISVGFRRGTVEKNTTVKLGSRADNAEIQRVPRARMERMQRMGATLSRVRADFPSVIQTDMPIDPNDTGAPVLDLDGKVAGITIARGSRIKSFIIPTDVILRTLAFDPRTVSEALALQTGNAKERGQTRPRSRITRRSETSPAYEDPAARVRRLLGEMEKNNNLNRDILREVEEHLRNFERDNPNRR